MSKSKLKVCVFTAARSDYFLLKPLLRQLQNNDAFILQLVVSGMHMSAQFGETWKLIAEDVFLIDEKISMLSEGNEVIDIISSMGCGMTQYGNTLSRLSPDAVIILGDRFEMMTFSLSAYMLGIPIAHIHGGELTYGSFDDGMRHCITKMALLHFPATEEYRRRVIQMGEHPENVLNVGALAVENIHSSPVYDIPELSKRLDIPLREKFFLVTFHPETRNDSDSLTQVKILIEALSQFPDYQVIWTMANADPQGKTVNNLLKNNKNKFFLIDNLGDLYIPILKKASAIIGNSSSGIIEAPIAGIPTINIGTRQEGRLKTDSIIDCLWNMEDIKNAILKVNELNRSQGIDCNLHPYGNGDSAAKIIEFFLKSDLRKNKTFYDFSI